MKRRILALAMCLMLCVGLLPMAASADGKAAEVWTPDLSSKIGEYDTLQDAVNAAKEAGQYAGIKLLQDVLIEADLTLDTDINLFLNDHTLTLDSGVTVSKGGALNNPTIDLWNSTSSSPQHPGEFVINGTMETNLCVYGTTVTMNDDGTVEMLDVYAGTININGGSVHALITDGGTYHISGGVMCLDMFDNNGMEDVDVTVSGDACIYFSTGNGIMVSAPQYWDYDFHLTLDGGYYDADPRLLYTDQYKHIDLNGNWNSVSDLDDTLTYYIKSGDTYTEIAIGDITNDNLNTSNGENGSIYVCLKDFVTVDESKIEQYNGQADWAVQNHNTYSWRIQSSTPTAPVTLTDSTVSGATISYKIANLPENAKLVAARYDDGRLTDIQVVSPPAESGTLTMAGSGAVFKLFLLDGTTSVPLCQSWVN